MVAIGIINILPVTRLTPIIPSPHKNFLLKRLKYQQRLILEGVFMTERLALDLPVEGDTALPLLEL